MIHLPKVPRPQRTFIGPQRLLWASEPWTQCCAAFTALDEHKHNQLSKCFAKRRRYDSAAKSEPVCLCKPPTRARCRAGSQASQTHPIIQTGGWEQLNGRSQNMSRCLRIGAKIMWPFPRRPEGAAGGLHWQTLTANGRHESWELHAWRIPRRLPAFRL